MNILVVVVVIITVAMMNFVGTCGVNNIQYISSTHVASFTPCKLLICADHLSLYRSVFIGFHVIPLVSISFHSYCRLSFEISLSNKNDKSFLIKLAKVLLRTTSTHAHSTSTTRIMYTYITHKVN